MARRKKEEVKSDPFDIIISSLEDAAKTNSIFSYKPHAKQQAFHEDPAKVRTLIGGNRSGKTHAGCAEGVFWLRGKHPYRKIPDKKIQGRVVGVDFVNGVGKILLPKYAEIIPPSALINGSWEDSWSPSEKMLTFDNGNTVEFMSYDQELDKFAGTSRDFIHFDEEPPESIFNENRARVVDVNGDVWLTMTPLDGFTWTYKKLYLRGLDPDEPNYFTIEVSMEDNPALSAEARELYLDSLGEEERKAREHGQYMSVGGKVYKSFTPQSHVIKYDYDWISRKLADGWALYESVDHGWNNPTAWIWALVSPAGSPLEIVVVDEHVQSEMTIPEHAEIVRDKRRLYGQPAITTGDPAMAQTSALNGLSAISTYAENGIYIGVEGVPKGPGSVKIGVEKLNRYFQKNKNGIPHMRIMDECPILIEQLGLLRWKSYKGKAKDENNKYEEIQKKDDHAPDALRYMATLMPDLQREGPEVEKVDSTGFSPKPLTPEQMNIDPLLAKMRMGDTGEYFTVGEDSDSEWTVVDAY